MEGLCLPKIHMLKLYPHNVMVLRGGALGRVIRIRWAHEGGFLMNGISGPLRVMENSLLLCSLSCEAIRSRLPVTQKRTLTMLAPWSQTSSLQNCEKKTVVFYRLSGLWYFCYGSWLIKTGSQEAPSACVVLSFPGITTWPRVCPSLSYNSKSCAT